MFPHPPNNVMAISRSVNAIEMRRLDQLQLESDFPNAYNLNPHPDMITGGELNRTPPQIPNDNPVPDQRLSPFGFSIRGRDKQGPP